MSHAKVKLTSLIAGAMLSFSFLSFAQYAPAPATGRTDFEIRSVTHKLAAAPDYQVSTGRGTRAPNVLRQWLQVEVEFDSSPEWADDVLLKYYVLIGRGRDAKLFGGEVTHVNVSKGRKHYSAMFMHPNTVERFGRGEVEAVAVQLWHQGRLVDQASNPSARERWWERFSPTPGFLLNPLQTPWAMVSFERYEQLKPAP